MPEVRAQHRKGEDVVVSPRGKRPARLRIHVENNPSTAAVYHVTPALFRKSLKASVGLAAKIEVSFGMDPDSLDGALAETEVLLSGGLDANNLAARAPRLK